MGSVPVVIGNTEILRFFAGLLKIEKLKFVSGRPTEAAAFLSKLRRTRRSPGVVYVLDLPAPKKFKIGRPSAAAGRLAVAAILLATDLARRRSIEALVTAPLSKTSLKLADFTWPGQTEMLADFTGTKKFRMMFVSPKLKVVLATIHQPLKTVSRSLTRENIFATIALGYKSLLALGLKKPKIAVAGFNPHAGEEGRFGDEEAKVIRPAIKQAQARGWPVDGPWPPDTLFLPDKIRKYDLFVCLYHDQGLIPLKMTAFDQAVNTTVGLPFPRTSPDHGTAFDIAGRGQANPASFLAAYQLATRLANN